MQQENLKKKTGKLCVVHEPIIKNVLPPHTHTQYRPKRNEHKAQEVEKGGGKNEETSSTKTHTQHIKKKGESNQVPLKILYQRTTKSKSKEKNLLKLSDVHGKVKSFFFSLRFTHKNIYINDFVLKK